MSHFGVKIVHGVERLLIFHTEYKYDGVDPMRKLKKEHSQLASYKETLGKKSVLPAAPVAHLRL